MQEVTVTIDEDEKELLEFAAKGDSKPLPEGGSMAEDAKVGKRINAEKLTVLEKLRDAVADLVHWARHEEAPAATQPAVIGVPVPVVVEAHGEEGEAAEGAPEAGAEGAAAEGAGGEQPAPEGAEEPAGPGRGPWRGKLPKKPEIEDLGETVGKVIRAGVNKPKPFTIHSSRAMAFKALDGSTWWLQWTTNAFKDRESEIFTTKSIDDFISRHDKDAIKGQFWYRHIPGTKFADIKWQARVGRCLAQTGPFDSTPVGTAFKEFFTQYPQTHPTIAPEGWGCSHGYLYQDEDRKDGVYEWFDIKESSVLPASAASNPHNPPPVILQGGKLMNEQQLNDLKTIGGEELVALVTKTGEQHTKELEQAGVAYKEAEGIKAKVPQKILDHLEEIEDTDLRKALRDELTAAFQAVGEVKADEDKKKAEADAAACGKYPKPESKELSEDEKAKGLPAAIAKALDKIKDAAVKSEVQKAIEDVFAKYAYPQPKAKELEEAEKKVKGLPSAILSAVDKITDAAVKAKVMSAIEEHFAKYAYPEPKKGTKPTTAEEYPAPAKKGDETAEVKEIPVAEVPTMPTRGEIVSALKAVVDANRTELATAVTTLTEQLKALSADLAMLKEADETKVARKAAALPRASQQSLYESIFGPQTQIDGRSALAKEKPAEPEDDGSGGTFPIPFVNQMLAASKSAH